MTGDQAREPEPQAEKPRVPESVSIEMPFDLSDFTRSRVDRVMPPTSQDARERGRGQTAESASAQTPTHPDYVTPSPHDGVMPVDSPRRPDA